jgi:hypothetical protein
MNEEYENWKKEYRVPYYHCPIDFENAFKAGWEAATKQLNKTDPMYDSEVSINERRV